MAMPRVQNSARDAAGVLLTRQMQISVCLQTYKNNTPEIRDM